MLQTIFVVAAMLMAACAGRLVFAAARTVRLHRHGVRTTGTVVRIWEDEGSDGGIQLRAVVDFDVPDRLLGSSTYIPARRRGGTLQVGDALPVVYDAQEPTHAQVMPAASCRLLVAAGVMITLALGACGFAVFLVGMAFKSA